MGKVKPGERPNEEFDYIDISSIDRTTKTITSPKRLRGSNAPSRARQRVQTGDVLFSTVRPNLRTIARVPAQLDGQIASTGFCVLRPAPAVSADFVFYAVLANEFQNAVARKARGVSYPAVRDPDILDETIDLPPRAEQDAIVAKIETLLGFIAEGEETLRGTRALLSRYLSAALAETFSVDSYTRLADVADVQSGIAKGRPPGANSVEMPYISTANVQAGRLDLSVVKTLQIDASLVKRYRLRAEDVLVVEGGDADKVGRGWIWSAEIEPCLHQNHVFAVRAKPGLLEPQLLAYYISAPQARTYFLRSAKQTVNLASINMTQLKALPIPDLTIDVQRRLVRRLDRLASAVNDLEIALEDQARYADALRRSALDKALAGELTAAAPGPDAIDLLAEIEAERTATGVYWRLPKNSRAQVSPR